MNKLKEKFVPVLMGAGMAVIILLMFFFKSCDCFPSISTEGAGVDSSVYRSVLKERDSIRVVNDSVSVLNRELAILLEARVPGSDTVFLPGVVRVVDRNKACPDFYINGLLIGRSDGGWYKIYTKVDNVLRGLDSTHIEASPVKLDTVIRDTCISKVTRETIKVSEKVYDTLRTVVTERIVPFFQLKTGLGAGLVSIPNSVIDAISVGKSFDWRVAAWLNFDPVALGVGPYGVYREGTKPDHGLKAWLEINMFSIYVK